jgi:dTDP-4-dehydrorhamnose reductase
MECTVSRVGTAYTDQLELSRHATRPSDLDRFADLGIRTMRYPVLWERTAPAGLEAADWSWTDERLGRLRELGIRPIVGLVHHGSGPRDTSLVDPMFATGLAAYARAVAERYPWLDAYTPVNEPLTTARFSGLYGHWYPHGHDERTFLRALLGQVRATSMSMHAIRKVNPKALLIQTEDLGKTFSTAPLGYQADFENERRWLSFDLLMGRVDRTHPLWGYLRWVGIPERQLGWFLRHPCPPDIMGINYYLTSERLLDHRLDRYPSILHGGNGRDRYADVPAVRVMGRGLVGLRVLLREAWDRYRLPIAVTEVHNGCTREEQLRWLMDVWRSAQAARRHGVDVRAVTAWSLLGTFDWDSLLTLPRGHYEPGVFDLRAPAPRPTAIATAIRALAKRGTYDHPVLDTPGWWRRAERLEYPPFPRRRPAPRGRKGSHSPRPILITGRRGTLGQAFARICDARGIAHQLLTRQKLDIADPASVAAAMDELRPWAVINTAGYVRVDDAEREPDACFRENTRGPGILAAACAQYGAQLVTYSSDLVFDGKRRTPYAESARVNPLNVYGKSKAAAEAEVLDILPTGLVIRTSAFFGPWDQYNFVTLTLDALRQGQQVRAVDDAFVSPTYVPDLVHASLDLLIDGEEGIWHLANGGAVTWAEFGRQAAEAAGLDPDGVIGVPISELELPAPRPRFSVLGSERGTLLPPLGSALQHYLDDCRAA